MYDPNSPIRDFYPSEFEQDLNGKKQEWEAVVKIPFIDEDRLLRAMACGYHSLFNCAHPSQFLAVSSTRTPIDRRGEATQYLWIHH